MVAQIPLLSCSRAPFVTDASSVGDGEPSRRSAAGPRPSFVRPPAKGSTVLRIRVPFTVSVAAVHGDRSPRLCLQRSPLTPLPGRSIAKRPTTVPGGRIRASAFDASAGESQRLFDRPEPPRPDERSVPGWLSGSCRGEKNLSLATGLLQRP